MLGGRAIDTAHELYSSIDNLMMLPTYDNCPSPSPFVSRPLNLPLTDGEKFSVLPNPVIDQVEVQAESIMTELTLSNLTLEPIAKFAPMQKKFSFTLNDVPAGLYLITIITEKGSTTQRIIHVK